MVRARRSQAALLVLIAASLAALILGLAGIVTGILRRRRIVTPISEEELERIEDAADLAGLEPAEEVHESELMGYLQVRRTGDGARARSITLAWCLEHASKGRRKKTAPMAEVFYHERERLRGHGCASEGCCVEWD